MKFLKEIITRKHTETDSVNIDDMAAMLGDAEAEESSNAEIFNNLAAIQSRIKGTQSGKLDPNGEDLQSVKDFSEVVDDILEPQDQQMPESAAPVMTEEDYMNLDNELARMSKELEDHFEIEAIDARQDANQMGAIRENRQAQVPPDATAVRVPEPERTSKPQRPSAFGAAPKTERPAGQKPGTISISEAQGGGANVDTAQSFGAKPDVAAQKPADPEQAKVEQVQTMQPEPEKPALVAAPEPAQEPILKTEVAPTQTPRIVEVPAPAAGRSGRRAGRVKTRLLGFEHSNGTNSDPFSEEKEVATSTHVDFPVGWIVVVEGPGRGAAFSLMSGVSQIGRGEDQAIKLDFGDSSISRLNHAAIAYDNEQNSFFLGHGGKANLVRLNNKPVLSTEEINDTDLIRIGETTLRFVALCGGDFNWAQDEQEQADNAANA